MSDGLTDRVRALCDLATVEAVYDPGFTMLRAGFSDFGFTIEDLFSTEDRVGVFDQLAMLSQLGALGG